MSPYAVDELILGSTDAVRVPVKRSMPRVGGFRSFNTARRTIQGFEAMLWLRKGFGLAGAWKVREQNRLLAICFVLPQANKGWKRDAKGRSACQIRVCDTPVFWTQEYHQGNRTEKPQGFSASDVVIAVHPRDEPDALSRPHHD